MKKCIGIWILAVYVFAYGEGHQLLRIPYLVKHYQKHKQADPRMTVARFIRIHYIEQVPQGDDFQQDKQLPFRTIDVSLMAALYKSEPASIEIQPLPAVRTVHRSYEETNKPLYNPLAVFQPPRNA
ncbi:hypothetical protein [Sediminibacterium soli]|uniref:hypothetical protein n=1 Tax=Sediminibacterium soli TaxID=2698829 RepID=UPI0013797577|nr:hypothetical protein [Sediminibacterium soli]NCI45977.1 hypothetical protein [Sediminibacterium soli]